MTHFAIGFLRKNISGEAWQIDQARIHALADEREWPVIIMYFGDPSDPRAVINRLMTFAYDACIAAVITPSIDHFESGDLPALVKIIDVFCADTGRRYSIPTQGDRPGGPSIPSPRACSGPAAD